MVAVTASGSFGTGRVVALAATALSLAGLGFAVAAWCAVAKGDSLTLELLGDLPFAGFVLVGLLVVAARPANGVGWWMLVGGVCSSMGGAGVALAEQGIQVDPGSVPAVAALAIVGQGLRGVGWAALTLVVPALFPTGRVKSARWRWMYPALAAVLISSMLDPLLDPKADLTDLAWRNPVAPHGFGQVLSLPVFLAHIPLSAVLTVAAVVQLVQRWRAGGEVLRQQLLLFAAAAALAALASPIAIWIGGGSWIFSVGTALMPVAIGFAVLARGLYDLRTATNRTLVWLTLSVCVAAVLALVITLGTLAEVKSSTPWLSWLAAGVAAACFAPLRDLMQRGVNRVTYGRWTEPYELLAMLGRQVEASVDVDRLLAVVQSELESLGLREVRVTAADEQPGGDSAADLVAIPLSAYGLLVGTLSYREPDQPLRARDRRLIEDLAGHLGGVLHARMLMQDLQRARERLVLGREEERRRLRRDLHDGLGPALAGHLLRLDVIAGRVGADGEAARLVDSLREELRDTVQDVRRLVEGLRPPALDELGLVGALRQAGNRLASGSRVRMEIRAADLPALPAGVEVAAYRIATEAMTNVVKHARATTCVVDIAAEPSTLHLRIQDDGRGLAIESGFGHGLRTMRERAEELRGSLTISGADGTDVVARLPLNAGVAPAAPTVPQPVEARP